MNKTTTATPAYKIADYDDSCTGANICICKAKQNGSYTFYTVGSAANLADNASCTNTEVFATKEQIKKCCGTRPTIYENKITWNIPTQTTTVDYNYFTTNVCDSYKIAAPNLLYTEDDNHNKTYYTYAGYYDGTNIYNTFSIAEPSTDANCYILLKQPTITAELCDNLIDFTLTPTIINANETTLSSSTTPELPDINCHIIYIDTTSYRFTTCNTKDDSNALICYSQDTARDYLFYYSISANNSTINSPLINVRTSTSTSNPIESQTNFVL